MKKAILARAQAEAAARRSTGDSKDGESGADGSATGAGDTPGAQATPTTIPALDAVRTEQLDEVLQTLKTTFPLLILSLETMVDQIQHKFKPAPEEDVYRTVCMLLTDAIQVSSFVSHSICLTDQLPTDLCRQNKQRGRWCAHAQHIRHARTNAVVDASTVQGLQFHLPHCHYFSLLSRKTSRTTSSIQKRHITITS